MALVMVASADLYSVVATSDEVDAGLNNAGLVESETIQLFPNEVSEANFLNDQNIFSILAVTTCGRNGLPPCTPPPNRPRVPPNCRDPRNRDCKR
ncbi:hypothetical protein V6N13_068620 [Hibiscus sabdariffa]|uniref:Uncharacterized protein n=1 Tax=Hibiscus sabdariffa TaxID=183260 RepID=A0ABR2QN51_9ROSI